MKGATIAVLSALLVVTLGITDAEAGGAKKRVAVPTVLAPAIPPAPPEAPPVISPPPRVETQAQPAPSPPVVAEKKEPTCVWKAVSLPTKWEAAKTIQVQGMMVPLCDCCGGQRQLWLHGSYVQVPPQAIQGTALVLDCSTN